MRINNNIAAMNTYSRLSSAQGAQAKSLEKLSSGLRINRAGDDAAGLAISEKMRGQVSGLNQAARNAQDGISLIQTAEGGLNETHSILQRMRELAVQAGNDTNSADDRIELQKEFNELTDEVDRIAGNTEFNTQKLLNGDKKTEGFNFQIGANSNQSLELTIADMRSTALGTDGGAGAGAALSSLKVATDAATGGLLDHASAAGSDLDASGTFEAGEGGAIEIIDQAIKEVSSERSKLGANQNRLDHTINNLTTTSENLSAAESRIRDVDMAKEMMEFTKNNILNQASTAMLAQANQMPQGVLQLLG